jgi:CheY-like chemotaxis protein
MALESIANVLESLAALLGAVCWPLIVLFIVVFFGTHLRQFIKQASERPGDYSFKAGPTGFEATASFQSGYWLGSAEASRGEAPKVDTNRAATQVAQMANRALEAGKSSGLARARVLWVDDLPGNNVYERRSMEALGIEFELSQDTDDAVEKLKERDYDLVISDMGRPSGRRAGYDLLQRIRQELKSDIPFVIYASSNRPEHRAEAQRRGAVGSTNSPQELFQLVTTSLMGG